MIRHILRQGVLTLLFLPPALSAATDLVPRLVRDVDPTSYAGSSSPRQLAGVNHGFAVTVHDGRELWMYDEREDSWTTVLKREEIRKLAINVYAAREKTGGWSVWRVVGFPYFSAGRIGKGLLGPPGPVYEEVPLLFEASDRRGRALWSAGFGDVKELAHPLPLADGRLLRDLTAFRNRSFFVARHRDLGTALWVTDGEQAAPVWAPVPGKAVPMFLAGVVRNRLLLAVSGGEPELWLSDGTARGTRPMVEIARGPGAATITDAFAVPGPGNRIFLIADDHRQGRQLWTSDGTAAGTLPLTRFAAPDPFGVGPLPRWTLQGRWPFFADDGVHGRELWWTDGTPAGTRLVADLCPGSCGTAGEPLQTILAIESLGLPEKLLFSASTSGQGIELWVTDGAPGGTAQVGDLCAGPCDSEPRDFVFGSYLSASFGATFTAATPDGTRALWLSDGTPENTRRLTPPGVAVTSRLSADLFSAADAEFGDEIWSTEGTPETTRLWMDLERERESGSYPAPLGIAGGKLLFTASVPGHGRQLWTSDGTAAGTVLIPPRPRGPQVSRAFGTATIGERMFFAAPARGTPDEGVLWTTDGTAQRTVRLTPSGVRVFSIYSLGQRAVFLAQDAEHGLELWVSDGTPASTHLVADLAPGPESIFPGYEFSTLLPGRLIFIRDDVLPRVWTTDGTAEGTRPLTDLYPFLSPLENVQLMLVEFGGRLFFLGSSPGNVYGELWVSDWTAAGTHPFGFPEPEKIVLGLYPAGSRLFLLVASDHGPELWVSDGTPGGTARVPATVFNSDVNPPLVVFGDRLVFADYANVLWITDGTAEGSFPVRDPAGESINVGFGRAVPFAGQLVFSAGFGFDSPCYVWDGSAAPAVPVKVPGTELGCRGDFFPVGSRLYFTGFEPHTGAELWVLEDPTSPAHIQP